jgi:hypothetical protein
VNPEPKIVAAAEAISDPIAKMQEAICKAVEKGAADARAAYAKAKTAAEEAAEALETSYSTAAKGLVEFNAKTLDALRATAEAEFDFIKSVASAKSRSGLATLQNEHARQRVEAISAQSLLKFVALQSKQAREIAALAQKVATETAESIRRQVAKTAVSDKSAFEPDARSRALLLGVKIAQDDLRSAGGAFNLKEARTLMRGISRQRIDRRVKEGSLLAVPGPSNRRRYPTVQFNRDGTVVSGLKEVRDALPTKNPWSVLNFLVSPESRLDGRKPIDLLKTGEVVIVVEAARRMGQQGA